jgi:hypothetical protein
MKAHKLQSMIEAVLPAINGRSSLPVLSHVLLEYKDGELSISADDLNQRLTALWSGLEDAEASTSQAWAMCVKPKELLLATALHGKPYADIKLTPSSDPLKPTLKVEVLSPTGWTGTLHIEGLPKEEFPSPTEFPGDNKPVHPWVLDGIIGAAPCMSNDETRYILNGVHLDPQANCVVATNGRILAVHKLPPNLIPFEVILRKETVALLQKDLITSINKVDGDDRIEKIQIIQATSWGVMVIQSKPLNGNYPNWPTVLPTEKESGKPSKHAWDLSKLPPSNFLKEWEGVRILPPKPSSGSGATALLCFYKGSPKGPSATLEVETNAVHWFDGKTVDGKDPQKGIAVNPQFLDIMRQVFGAEAKPVASGWTQSTALSAEAETEDGRKTSYVFMPLRGMD